MLKIVETFEYIRYNINIISERIGTQYGICNSEVFR